MVLTNEVTLIVGQTENNPEVQDGYQNSPKFHTMGVHYFPIGHYISAINGSKPAGYDKKLREAMNKDDVETALSCYQDQAVLIAQHGNIARDRDEIRAVLEGFVSLKLSLRGEAHQLVEAGDIALYCSRWMLVGTSPEDKHVEMTGVSSDLLRRQNDGQWIIAVDNLW